MLPISQGDIFLAIFFGEAIISANLSNYNALFSNIEIHKTVQYVAG